MPYRLALEIMSPFPLGLLLRVLFRKVSRKVMAQLEAVGLFFCIYRICWLQWNGSETWRVDAELFFVVEFRLQIRRNRQIQRWGTTIFGGLEQQNLEMFFSILGPSVRFSSSAEDSSKGRNGLNVAG